MAIRESLPTLTEEDLRAEGERITIPTPIPAEVVRWMMAEAEDGSQEAPPREAPVTRPPSSATRKTPAAGLPAIAARKTPAAGLPAMAARRTPAAGLPAMAARKTPAAGLPKMAARWTPAVRSPVSAARAPTASGVAFGAEEELEITEMPASEQADVVDELVRGYLQQLGSRAHVPFASLSPEHVHALQLDHWAGFVLSLVDGHTSIEDIVDAAPMPEHEALRMLADLQKHGIIDVRAPAPPRPAPPPPAPKAPKIQSALGDGPLTLDDIESWT